MLTLKWMKQNPKPIYTFILQKEILETMQANETLTILLPASRLDIRKSKVRTGWLWFILEFDWSGWDPSVSGSLSSLVLDGVALFQIDPVHNLEALLDSQVLLEVQVADMPRRAFAQLHVVQQLCSFLDKKALLLITHTLSSPFWSIATCSTWSYSWEILGSSSWYSHKVAHIRPLLLKLWWVLVCFEVQFKVFAMTFKFLHGSHSVSEMGGI